MKLVRYQTDGAEPKFGCVVESDLFEIDGYPLNGAQPSQYVAPLEQVRLLAPCEPRKVVAMAINFAGIDGYSPQMLEPLPFIKPGSSVCGPGEKVINPFPQIPWWGEAELAAVIRKPLRKATEAEVEQAVLGFTIGNDVTVENIEGRDHHLARSKCPDLFCPLGPWIDTEFDPSDCLIEAVQNGLVVRRAQTSEQIWSWRETLSQLSSWMTLEPWDVVLMGNAPDTVGMRFLEDGDIYSARIQGLGELTNQFFVDSSPQGDGLKLVDEAVGKL